MRRSRLSKILSLRTTNITEHDASNAEALTGATSMSPAIRFLRSIGLPRVFRSVESMQIFGLILAVLGLALYMNSKYPTFWTEINREIMILNFIFEATIAIGMTIVIIIGGIDLSVAAVLPFSAIVVGKLLNDGVSVPLAIALALGASAMIGFINAAMTNIFRVHPFISTLAMLLTLRGVNLVITDGSTVYGFPKSFNEIGQGRTWNIPNPILIFAVLAVVIGFLLMNHKYFRQAYFIGGNRRSARMSGIHVERFLIFVFVLSSTLAGIAGIVTAAYYGAASNSYGQNMELRVITAVVIGGASLSGGTGSVLGTTLGVLFMAMVYNLFFFSDVSTYWQDVVIGTMLLGAVFLSEFLKRRRVAR